MDKCEIRSESDRRLARLLQLNGRVSNAELAKRVGLSESACLRRVRQLEESGVIVGYRAVLDQRKVGLPISAIVLVSIDQRTETDRQMFIEAVAREPRVTSCAAISGDHDFVLTAVASDIDDLGRLAMERLLSLPSVSSVSSSLVFKWLKRDGALPL